MPRPRGGGSVAVLQPPPTLRPSLLKSNLPALFPSARKPATLVDVVDLETLPPLSLPPPLPHSPPPPPDTSFVAFRGRGQLQGWIKAGRGPLPP